LTSANWTLQLEAEPDEAQRQIVEAALRAYNDQAGGPSRRGTLAVTVRGADGAVVGGLWGRTGYGYLFIERMYSGPARGVGLGRAIMELAEAEARRRGLIGIWLDTWTFQAPGFYQKLGFIEFGRITDYPPGHDRIFYSKRIA
jgi:GNAT superfamily N-acetyltransferase